MPTKFLTALAALLAVLTLSVVVVTDDDPDGKRHRTVTIRVGNDTVRADTNKTVQMTEERAAADKTPTTPDIHEDAVDETPPGITVDEAQEAKITPPGIGAPKPPAGAQNYSLTHNYVVNASQRAPGTKVSMFCIHFTVSRPGTLAQIRHLFNTPSFGASSHIGLELDGEAELWVPFHLKSWTQGAFNSVCDSVEIVTNDLTRQQWLDAPIIKKGILAQIVADRLRARGLPPRLVDPVGCTPKAGYTDHARLECGNSHWDVGLRFPWDVFGKQVRQRYSPATAFTKAQVVACRKLTWWRATRESGQARRNAVLRRRTLASRGLRCNHGKLARA